MKDLEFYLSQNYRIEIVADEDEGGYVFSHPDLKGCITCANDYQKGITLLSDARKEWLKAAYEDNYEIPLPDTQNQYSGQFKLRIPKSLHKTLAEESKREGISMNQYCLFLLSNSRALTPHLHNHNK